MIKKNLFFMGLIILSTAAVARTKEIYDALDVEEINITPRGLAGSVTYEKSVGGLVCQKTSAVVLRPLPQFICEFTENIDAQAIYEALSVEEINVTPEGLVGYFTLEKSVAGLTCRKGQAVVLHPVPEFSCELQ